MSDELVPTADLGIQKYDNALFSNLAKGNDYFPWVQLFHPNSEACQTGVIPGGTYGMCTSKEDITPLSGEFICLVLGWRPRAMDTSGESIISIHDPSDPEFGRIARLADVKDSGCMVGPEFLLYLPVQDRYACFFCSSKSAKRAAPQIKDLIGKGATFTKRIVKKGSYVWPAPVVTAHSAPMNVPDTDDIKANIDKFMNPPKIEVAQVSEAEEARER